MREPWQEILISDCWDVLKERGVYPDGESKLPERIAEALDGQHEAIGRALELLADDNLDRGDGMSLDTMLAAIREAREVLEGAR